MEEDILHHAPNKRSQLSGSKLRRNTFLGPESAAIIRSQSATNLGSMSTTMIFFVESCSPFLCPNGLSPPPASCAPQSWGKSQRAHEPGHWWISSPLPRTSGLTSAPPCPVNIQNMNSIWGPLPLMISFWGWFRNQHMRGHHGTYIGMYVLCVRWHLPLNSRLAVKTTKPLCMLIRGLITGPSPHPLECKPVQPFHNSVYL